MRLFFFIIIDMPTHAIAPTTLNTADIGLLLSALKIMTMKVVAIFLQAFFTYV